MLSRTCSKFMAYSVPVRMRAVVGVKRVVDYTVKVRVKDNKMQTDGLKMSVNPFDDIAIEEAIQLKEKKQIKEVIAVTIGSKKAEDALRTALALGCDKAIHIVVPDAGGDVDSLVVAKVFQKLHDELKPDLWLLGKQAVDGDFGSTPQLLAGLLDIPQGTFASKVEIHDGKAKITREVDAGHQVLEMQMPCVIAADLRLNTPRFPKLPSIMKARKMPIDVRKIDSFGIDTKPRLQMESLAEPVARKAGIKVKTVEELYEKLHDEAKVF